MHKSISSKYKKKLAYMLFEKSNLSNCASLIACSDDECLKLKKMFPKQCISSYTSEGLSDFKKYIDQEIKEIGFYSEKISVSQ